MVVLAIAQYVSVVSTPVGLQLVLFKSVPLVSWSHKGSAVQGRRSCLPSCWHVQVFILDAFCGDVKLVTILANDKNTTFPKGTLLFSMFLFVASKVFMSALDSNSVQEINFMGSLGEVAFAILV
eukprot:6477153-Amphidinium_carterae.3